MMAKLKCWTLTAYISASHSGRTHALSLAAFRRWLPACSGTAAPISLPRPILGRRGSSTWPVAKGYLSRQPAGRWWTGWPRVPTSSYLTVSWNRRRQLIWSRAAANASAAALRSLRLCAADTCVLIRALPTGTTG